MYLVIIMKKLIIILIVVTGAHSFSIPFLSNAMDMVSLVTDISDLATGRHDLTAGNLFKKKVDPTLAKVNQLSEQINELTNTLNVKMDKLMNAVLEDVPRAIQFASLMRKLIGYVSRIDELFDDYQFYVRKFGDISQFTIEDFSRVTTSHKYGDVPDILRQIYHLFIPGQLDQKDESLLDAMTATLKSANTVERCNQLKSAQQQLFNLYETVVITEIKAYTMSTYAFGLLTIYQNSSFKNEIERMASQTIFRCSQYLMVIEGYLGGLGLDIFLCDPPKHIRGETFVEINSIRGVVLNEVQIDSTHPKCYWNCDLIIDFSDYARPYKEGTEDEWNPSQPCHGRMKDCKYIGYTTICELDEADKYRRYSWIKNDMGIFGEKDDCENGTIRKIDPYYADGSTCSTCFCECSEMNVESKAIRTISLRKQMAYVQQNMIVTGVRFQEKDKIIHVQIEQGKLLGNGLVQSDTIKWKELEDFEYLDNVEDGGFEKVDGYEVMIQGVDYQFIYNGQRDVNLDDVYSLEAGWIVTGLKMSRDPDNSKAVQLDVHLTQVNLTTGILDTSSSKWITHKDMPGHDKPYNERKDIDVRYKYNGAKYYDNIPSSEDFSLIWFTQSNREEEMEQYTLPFLDSRSVTPTPRIPLEGVSLFHRSREDSGGFLGFRLKTVSIPKYLNSHLSPETVELFQNDIEIDIIHSQNEFED